MTRFAILVVATAILAGCSLEHVPDGQSDAIATVETDVTARLDYLELPATDAATVATTRDFYTKSFGWTFTDFGPEYSATTTGDTDVGLSGISGDDAIDKPLPVIRVDDLEASLSKVEVAGGRIVRPIFAFPGGRRFHAVDPAGNEFAVYIVDDSETGE